MFNTPPGGQYREFHSDESESDPEDAPTHQILPSGTRKNRWHHIQDLDSFFARVYDYHQHHGLVCMALDVLFDILRFVFIVWFTTELRHCIDYSILFADHDNAHVTLLDGFRNRTECHQQIKGDSIWVLFLLISAIYGATRTIKLTVRIFHFIDIKNFYHEALGISSEKLDHLSWMQIQKKLLEAQKLNQMCIHKEELTELDVHNRILRYKNYMISMVHRDILPLSFNLPFIGETTFLTEGLKINIEWLLFGAHAYNPWAPFSSFQLKPQYKRRACREERASDLKKRIFYLGIVNLLALPLIFIFQAMWTFFNYLAVIRREPGLLGMRKWSLYSQFYLRHYNELNHQFKERLSRAIKPANRYMESFLSYPLIECAKFISFLCSAVLGVFLILGIIDDDFFRVEHALSAMTLLGIILGITLSLVPDEFFVPLHSELLGIVRDHVHYIPPEWTADPRSSKTQKYFSQLFQMKLSYILEELISPLVTPFILIFKLQYRAPEIVDFLRNYTVDVQGVGDVCSFAQLDTKRAYTEDTDINQENDRPVTPKTELSLINFSIRHPNWKPPQEGQQLLDRIQQKLSVLTPQSVVVSDPMLSSLSPLGTSLLQSRAPMLPNITENSVESYTNETQRLLAQSVAAYHDLGTRRLITSMPTENEVDVLNIDPSAPLSKSVQ